MPTDIGWVRAVRASSCMNYHPPFPKKGASSHEAFLTVIVRCAVLVVFVLSPSEALPAPAPVKTIRTDPGPAQAFGLSLPASDGAEPTKPSTTQWLTEATYGSWQLRCLGAGHTNGQKMCSAVLEVVDQKSKQVLLTWVIEHQDEDRMASVIQTPTSVSLQPGVRLQLGEGTPRQINYVNCLPQRCTATALMDKKFIEEAASNQKAMITIFAINGQSIQFGIPINGLDEALSSVR